MQQRSWPPVGDLMGLVGARSRAVPRADVTGTTVPSRPPSRRAAWRELTSPLAAGRVPAAAVRLARAPRGDGHVVVDLPGLGAPEVSNAPVRAYLRALGYDARGWGLGTNHGRPARDGRQVARLVTRLAQESGAPVSLVGWSLGGVIAREVARSHPDAVRRVITYGTPVVGGATFTVVARRVPPAQREEGARLVAQLDADSPITVPLTAIYSRRDGIVAWPSCIDRVSPHVEHVEVASTHIGLGFDPDVWAIVADRLARPVSR